MVNLVHHFFSSSRLLIVLLITLSSNFLFADGSKDLYPAGAKGGRAFLYSNSSTTGATMLAWPFKTLGTHYAYVKAGEIIHAASSAQGLGTGSRGRIVLTAPNGTTYTSAANATGRISTRAEELAGPRLSTQGSGANRYTTFNQTAAANQTGIWKIEFLPTSTENTSGTPSVPDNTAIDSWSQLTNTSLISAWDISVESSGRWISGRVYTNVANLHINVNQTSGFYGEYFALTNDGYIYRVNNNGNNGVGFTFFINNRGLTENNVNTYKSLDYTNISDKIHPPTAADDAQNVTQKIFYLQPAADLPENAIGSVPGGSTWLKNKIILPIVKNVGVIGVDGTQGQINSAKGGYVKFNADSQGTYIISIESTNTPATFTKRTLTGTAVMGTNNIYWDGKDGNGNGIPQGTQNTRVKVQLRGAEVHFPFIDMEINPNGLILELLNGPDPSNERFRVYWNDEDISFTNTNKGKKSNPINASINGSLSGPTGTGGHMWGQETDSTNPLSAADLHNGFGNEKSMDTWSYIQGQEASIETPVIVRKADLQISNLTADKTSLVAGQSLVLTVKAKNNGPSNAIEAPFSLSLPPGLTQNGITFTGSSCGTESSPLVYDSTTRTYNSKLNLPNQCEITYTISVTITAAAVKDYGLKDFTATIMRPFDFEDPDATNNSISPNIINPTDPWYEINNNGYNAISNNYKIISLETPMPTCASTVLYYENFGTSFSGKKNGRSPWAITAGKKGPLEGGVISNGYAFSPGYNDPSYNPSLTFTHTPTGVGATPSNPVKYSHSHIPDAHYAVVAPIYTRLGWDPRSFTDNTTYNGSAISPNWQPGKSYPEVYDWTNTYPWNNPTDPALLNVTDMSGSINGAAFLVRGSVTVDKGVRPFYNVELTSSTLTLNDVFTLQLYSFVNYKGGDKYMIMDVVEKETGNILASADFVPTAGYNYTPGTGVDFGWKALGASFTVSSGMINKNIDIRIRGNRTTFGHTLIDDILFYKNNPSAVGCIPPVGPSEPVICTEPIGEKPFKWSVPGTTASPYSQNLTLPASNNGFIFDIYQLDNSFNLTINGTKLALNEIQFQSSGTGGGINIQFADGSKYEVDTKHNGTKADIWQMRGNEANPLIRVKINPYGVISLFGSKESYGPLLPLVLTNGNSLNYITWNTNTDNKIIVSQIVENLTVLDAKGYGRRRIDCTCIKPGSTGNPQGMSNTGITIKPEVTSQSSGIRWPENVPNGHLVLDAKSEGLVITHMTTAERDALTNPVTGMMIYNTDLKCVQLYRGNSPLIEPSRTGWNCIIRGCNEQIGS